MESRFSESKEYLLESIHNALDRFKLDDIKKTVDLLNESNQIFVYGAGRSGLAGRMFAMRLMQLGLRAFFIGETITPAVKDGDCVLFVSKTGETQTAIQAAEIVSERVKADIIVLTASPDSPLARYGDIIVKLDVENNEKDSYLAPLGTVFEDSAIIFLDALIASVMDEIGETEEGMKYRHPILV